MNKEAIQNTAIPMKNASKILKREIYHKSQPFSVLGFFWRRVVKLEAFQWCFVTKLNKAGR
jgi:hypothetical protein